MGNNSTDMNKTNSHLDPQRIEHEKVNDTRRWKYKLYHIKLYRVHIVMSGIQTHNFSGNRN